MWGKKCGRFTTLNVQKHECFILKIDETYSFFECPLWFLVFSARVLDLLCYHCYSCYKTELRLHTTIFDRSPSGGSYHPRRLPWYTSNIITYTVEKNLPRTQASSAAVSDLDIKSRGRRKRTWKRWWKTLVFSVMRKEFWNRGIFQVGMILNRELWTKNCQSEWQRSKFSTVPRVT